jgi:hypothetical protein
MQTKLRAGSAHGQVKSNAGRFPADFMFRLTRTETEALNRSQIATGSQKHRDPRFPPYAFTEHGAIQAANVLNSPRAVEMGIYVVRAFVQLRELLTTNKELARQFAQLEARLSKKLADHDQAIAAVLSAIRQLMNPPRPKRRGIGFTAKLLAHSPGNPGRAPQRGPPISAASPPSRGSRGRLSG